MENPRHPGQTSPIHDQSPTPWDETLAGASLFLVLGVFLILEEIPIVIDASERTQVRVLMFAALMLLSLCGVAIGWMRNFPRWSYPYCGLAVLVSVYMALASGPIITLFGFPLFGREMWILWALVPLLLACGAGLLVTRSFHPLSMLVDRPARDLTLITYTLFGALPLWAFISFDDLDWRFALLWVVVLTLVLAGTAAAYLRSRSSRQRVVSLTLGVLLSIAITTMPPVLYWLEYGWVGVVVSIELGILLAAFMLAPAFLDLAQPSPKTSSA